LTASSLPKELKGDVILGNVVLRQCVFERNHIAIAASPALLASIGLRVEHAEAAAKRMDIRARRGLGVALFVLGDSWL